MKSFLEEQGRELDRNWVRTLAKSTNEKDFDLLVVKLKLLLRESNRAVIERVVEMIDGMVFREKSPNELIVDYLKRKNGYDTALSDLRAELMKEV